MALIKTNIIAFCLSHVHSFPVQATDLAQANFMSLSERQLESANVQRLVCTYALICKQGLQLGQIAAAAYLLTGSGLKNASPCHKAASLAEMDVIIHAGIDSTQTGLASPLTC